MTDITLEPRGPAGANGLNLYSDTRNPLPADGRDNESWLNTRTLTLFKKIAGTWGAVASIAPSPPKAGTPGAPGNTIYSDEGAPSTQLGRSGDFYVRKSAGVGIAIYGPKAGAVWPDPVPLVTMIVRQGAPISDDGVDGQVCVDVLNATLYGPKAAGAWPPGVALVGLVTGTGAPSAGVGLNGQTYLDTANAILYGKKTAGAWPASGTNLRGLLVGSGAPGAGVGVDGQTYIDIAAVAFYGPKAAGAWPAAPTPLVGLLTGTGAPAAGLGLNGQVYVDVAAQVLYGPKAGGAWPAGASLTGKVPLKPVEAWATGVAYVTGPPASYVSQGGSSYQCLVAHTSGTFATDLAGGKWGLVSQKGADGTGSGTVSPNGTIVAGRLATFTDTTGNAIGDAGVTGKEALLPVQTVAGASKAFTAADLYAETRRSNAGAAMTDTLPPAAAMSSLPNGSTLRINNSDTAGGILTLSPGSGTTISLHGATPGSVTIEGGRSTQWIYDKPNTTWRPSGNSLSGLLAANALAEIAALGATAQATARSNLGLSFGQVVGLSYGPDALA